LRETVQAQGVAEVFWELSKKMDTIILNPPMISLLGVLTLD